MAAVAPTTTVTATATATTTTVTAAVTTTTTTDAPSTTTSNVTSAVGATWNCKKCGLVNQISNWQCIACYSTMKLSLTDRKRDKNKNKKNKGNKGNNNTKGGPKGVAAKKRADIINKRQQKRAALAAKQSSDNDNTSVADTDDKKIDKSPHLAANIPKTMRALVKETDGAGFVLKTDYPVPIPASDEVLVRSFSVAICGSDLVLYNWDDAAKAIAKTPFIPGHECAGLVVGGGDDTRMRIGERVAIENHFYCGDCYQCNDKPSRKDICSNLNQFGHGKGTIYGGCCEYYTVKEKYCYRLRSNISWRDAALLEPLGVAHNACERAELAAKESVLIIGCGTVGCMAIGVAKTMGATNIIACDVMDNKLAIAKKMGATEVFNVKTIGCEIEEYIMKLTGNIGVGRLIECSGNSMMVNKVFKLIRKGGNIVLVGLPKKTLTFNNNIKELIQKSITLKTIHGRRIFKTWIETEKLVKNKKINLDLLVSHNLPLDQFEDGYNALKSGKALKVVFDLTK